MIARLTEYSIAYLQEKKIMEEERQVRLDDYNRRLAEKQAKKLELEKMLQDQEPEETAD